MKGTFLLSTAYSLLYLASASTIVRSRHTSTSLLIRRAFEPEVHTPESPKIVEDPFSDHAHPWDEDGDSQPETPKTIGDKIANLPIPTWLLRGPYNPARLFANMDTRGRSVWQLFKGAYFPRAKFQGNPSQLFELDPSGRPIEDGPSVDLTLIHSKLRTVEHTLLNGDKVTFIYKGNVDKGDVVTAENLLDYRPTFYTTQDGINKLNAAQGLFKPTFLSKYSLVGKRSNVLGTLSNVVSNPATNSTQDAAAVFEQYLEVFTTLQASIAALISPVLHSVTSQTNLTIIHQMAQSIYYDLIGSTTSLDGPFNYGLSFLTQKSNITTVQNNTTVTPGNITEIVTTLEEIYAAMWVQALTAANSTGLYAQHIHIASLLYTNDSSVFPAGFTTVDKSARADF